MNWLYFKTNVRLFSVSQIDNINNEFRARDSLNRKIVHDSIELM